MVSVIVREFQIVVYHSLLKVAVSCAHLRDCRKTLNPQIWYVQLVDFITCEIAKIGIFRLFRQSLNISKVEVKLGYLPN
jgi:hypothetical protein